MAALHQAAAACESAQILFGDVSLDIVPHADYETAIVRHASFRNSKLNHGAIKGEITVDRGGFSIRNINHEVVGFISPALEVSGEEGCDKGSRVMIRRVKPDLFVIVNGDTPVGTVQGRFPKNAFGVK